MTFHRTTDGLVCDECGCLVDPSERGRSSHTRWHDEVIDLREHQPAHVH